MVYIKFFLQAESVIKLIASISWVLMTLSGILKSDFDFLTASFVLIFAYLYFKYSMGIFKVVKYATNFEHVAKQLNLDLSKDYSQVKIKLNK